MSNKNLGDVVDILESLEDGLKLDINGLSKVQKDKTGDFIVISTVGGKKYRTYSKVVIETLEKVQTAKFDFTRDVLRAQVKMATSAEGNEYFSLVGQK